MPLLKIKTLLSDAVPLPSLKNVSFMKERVAVKEGKKEKNGCTACVAGLLLDVGGTVMGRGMLGNLCEV